MGMGGDKVICCRLVARHEATRMQSVTIQGSDCVAVEPQLFVIHAV